PHSRVMYSVFQRLCSPIGSEMRGSIPASSLTGTCSSAHEVRWYVANTKPRVYPPFWIRRSSRLAGGEAETEGRLDLRDHRGGQGRVPVRVRAPESSWIDHKTYAPEGFDRSLRPGAGSANRPAL